MNNRYMQSRQGFTLIELLVVISIIALLSTIILANLAGARAKARDATRKEEMLSLRNALNLYYLDHGSYPSTANWDGYGATTCSIQGTLSGPTGYIPNLAPTYISQLPLDPGGSTASCTGFQYLSDGTSYKLLEHVDPESYPSSGAVFYDPVRPTWAWMLCDGATACNTW